MVVTCKTSCDWSKVSTGKLWDQEAHLQVYVHSTVAAYSPFDECLQTYRSHTNLAFTVSTEQDPAVYYHLRVHPAESPDENWSYVGTDALSIPQDEPTMVLGDFTSATILHELGHALAAWNHEHQHQQKQFTFQRDAIVNDLEGIWTEEEIERNILSSERHSKYTLYDPYSIMHYRFPLHWIQIHSEDPLLYDILQRPVTTLSFSDVEQLQCLYPSDNSVSCVPDVRQFTAVPWQTNLVYAYDESCTSRIQESLLDSCFQDVQSAFPYQIVKTTADKPCHLLVSWIEANIAAHTTCYGQQPLQVRTCPNVVLHRHINVVNAMHVVGHLLGLTDEWLECPTVYPPIPPDLCQSVAEAAKVSKMNIHDHLRALYTDWPRSDPGPSAPVTMDSSPSSTSVPLVVIVVLGLLFTGGFFLLVKPQRFAAIHRRGNR